MTRLSALEVFRRVFLPALLLAAFTAQAAGLPDSGQITCYNDTGPEGVPASDPASIAGDGGSHPRQDCRYGRDVAAAVGVLPKIGGGAAGLDYTKIANDGSTLAATAVLGSNPDGWACTKDNITGLIWEIKTTAGLRDMGAKYSWYSTDVASNGGDAGSNAATAICKSTLPSCNTQAYVAAVNVGGGLCNATDWRMPTLRELQTLVLSDGSNQSIDPSYFPNTERSPYWTSSTYAPDPTRAWYIWSSYDGHYSADGKSYGEYVRLVRSGQF